MPEFRSYCHYVESTGDILHKEYHDNDYGYPLHSDEELFGRLVLEMSQAGLSWTTILKKRVGYSLAFEGFDIKRVAAYQEPDRQRLLADPGIIRNKLKVDAAIFNAQAILELQRSHGSFRDWLLSHGSMELSEWVKEFKGRFRFVGGEIVREFLTSTGFIAGAHEETCPCYQRILDLDPPWRRFERQAL